MAGRDEFKQVAEETYFDPDNCDAIDSEDIQGAVEDICDAAGISASPGFAFGREGRHSAGTWLIAAETSSNKRGLPFGLDSGKVRKVTVSTQNIPDDFTVQVWYHNGNLSGSTLVGSVTTTSTSDTEDFIVDWAVPKNVQIAVKISSVGNPKPRETGVFLVVKGTLD